MRENHENFEALQETRPCSVYFTRNPAACDDPRGLFTMPIDNLVSLYNQTKDLQEQIKIVDAYTERKNGLSKPVCKIEFKDLVEPKDSPYKSIQTSDDRGPPEHWAYCYNQTAMNPDDADKIKLTFGDKGAIQADSILPDNSVRMAFKKLDYNAVRDTYCQMNPGPIVGLNVNNVVTFNINRGSRVFDSSPIGVVDISGNAFNNTPTPNAVFLKLFERKRVGRSLVLAPRKDVSGKIYVLYMDICGSLFKKSEIPVTFTLDGVSQTIISGIPIWAESDIMGQYNTLMKQLSTRQADLNRASADTTLNLLQGLARTEYKWAQLPNWQPLNNARDIDNLISKSTYNGRVIDRTIYYWTSDLPHYYIRIWEGYLRIDVADTYEFKISTDDSGELFINGELVSSHYGYHGADDGAATLTSRAYPVGPISLKLRLVEQYGGHGIRYILWRRRGDYTWRHVPVGNFVYNTSVYNQDQAKADVDDLKTKTDALEPFYRVMIGDSSLLSDALSKAVKILAGKTIPSVLPANGVSFENKYYVVLDGIDTSMRMDMNWDITERQDILSVTPINIAASARIYKEIPMIDYTRSPVVYTIAFWLKVDGPRNYWRNILVLGEDYINGRHDRYPGIWIYPDNTSRVHFRMNSTRWDNDGQDLYSSPPDFGRWFHFAAVVNGNSVQLYLNGAPREYMRLPGNHMFTWYDLSRKKNMYINKYRYDGSVDDGQMWMHSLMWANRAFNSGEIASLTREYQVKYISGRYVRLQRVSWPPGGAAQGYINILEMTAYDRNDSVISAIGSLWPQYGDPNVFGGQFLVDRNIRADWWVAGGRTGLPHTTNHPNSYAEINLGSVQEIKSLVIENRRDCCTSRIIGTELQVLDNNRNVVWRQPITNDQATYRYILEL